MPGKLIPIDPVITEKILQGAVPGVGRWQHLVVEHAAFLEPKLTGDLAATVVADDPKVTSRDVTGRVRTQRYYARWQETKEEYHHKVGQAHAMADSVLLSAGQGAVLVSESIKAALGG